MSARNIALTGVPRSGTTLCCRMLGQATDTVALFEPMDVTALSAIRAQALGQVARFFADARASLLSDGTAWSQQVDGEVPDNPFSSETDADGRRRHRVALGRIRPDKPLSAGFNLVIKHNAAFTALLPELAAGFETWAIVRNPLAVLASWHSVDLPVTHGRLPAGEQLDPALARALDAEADVVARQLRILDWLFSRYLRYLPRERVLAYEGVVATEGAALADAVGMEMAPFPLQERNASRLYDAALCSRLADRLLADCGGWRSFYQERDVVDLLQRMRTSA
ncbi:hypothetical protein FQY83_14735 [Luteimonas marina]|uniref:Sulfotransferase n=1 Tax=Luteimonas marina TaxID=488485 RepID=A0A5C5TZQ2_9GAMM|nr:hypothetical protein [Luteimonas marina]TWT18630.1 hypothetical protein FQY83_14735 [Luteimonas marina]